MTAATGLWLLLCLRDEALNELYSVSAVPGKALTIERGWPRIPSDNVSPQPCYQLHWRQEGT